MRLTENKLLNIVREAVYSTINEAQKRTSARTSINSTKLPRFFSTAKKHNLYKRNTKNLDYGGGRFDNATEFLQGEGIENLVFDPFNRDVDFNRKSIEAIKNGGADTITCNNVLNVIDDDNTVESIVKNISYLLSDNGTAYFTVYVGNKSGVGAETHNGESWQRNQITDEYIPIIRKYFNKVVKKYDIIIATEPLVGIEDIDLFIGGNDSIRLNGRRR